MRSGTSIPTNVKGDKLLAYVYREMTHYRPYDGHDPQIGTYHGSVRERSKWYQQQDDLTLRKRNKQFLRLFKETDWFPVSDWLARDHAKEPYASPHRDRKSTLLQCILEMARANGAIKEAEDILCYILPNDKEPARPDEDGYLTDYRFDLVPRLPFGREGIYLDLYLDGSFDSTDKQKTVIGTFKTLRSGLEACRRWARWAEH